MKFLNVALLMSLALIAVSCGGDKKSGGGSATSSFSTDPLSCTSNVQEAFYYPANNGIQGLDGTYYIVSNQSNGAAFHQARQMTYRLQPVNGQYQNPQFRARVTGCLQQNSTYGQSYPYPNQYPNQYGNGQPQLIVTNIIPY